MLVSSLLMLCNDDEYPLKRLVKDCQRIHAYFEARDILTNMHAAPNKKNIERALSGLGYRIKTVQSSASLKTPD